MNDLSRYAFQVLRKDQEFVLYRGQREEVLSRILVLAPVAEYPAPEVLRRLEQAYSLKEELDGAWVARPTAITRHWNRTVLIMEDPGGIPLDQLLHAPLDLSAWLRLSISLSTALDHLHQRGVIHKDIKRSGRPCEQRVLAHGISYCFALAPRTSQSVLAGYARYFRSVPST